MGVGASLLLAPGQAMKLEFPFSAYPVLLCCCLGGLKNIVYAFGFGYGACMVSGGLLTISQAPPSAWARAACSLYVAYGARLGTFLLRRQLSDAYGSSASGEAVKRITSKTPFVAKCFVTVVVSLSQLAATYALQPCALAERFPALAWAGLGISGAGLLLETVADEQKNAAKQTQPNEPVMSGTYSIVRHPNYLGEVLFWGGVAVAAEASLPSTAPISRRFAGACGPLLMVWVMFGASNNLDRKGWHKYKDKPAYRSYVESTKSLIPGLW